MKRTNSLIKADFSSQTCNCSKKGFRLDGKLLPILTSILEKNI